MTVLVVLASISSPFTVDLFWSTLLSWLAWGVLLAVLICAVPIISIELSLRRPEYALAHELASNMRSDALVATSTHICASGTFESYLDEDPPLLIMRSVDVLRATSRTPVRRPGRARGGQVELVDLSLDTRTKFRLLVPESLRVGASSQRWLSGITTLRVDVTRRGDFVHYVAIRDDQGEVIESGAAPDPH